MEPDDLPLARTPRAPQGRRRFLRRSRWGCLALGLFGAVLACLSSRRTAPRPSAAFADGSAESNVTVRRADEVTTVEQQAPPEEDGPAAEERPLAALENGTSLSKETWMLHHQLEFMHKRWLRKRLLKILFQVGETKRHVSTVKALEQRGPDGSRLLQSGGKEDDAPPAPSGPPPRELMQLLAVEDRIRQLRHLRRISRAKAAAVQSERRLRVLRQHPVRRAALRVAQLAGVVTAGRLVVDVFAQVRPEMGHEIHRPAHSTHVMHDGQKSQELKSMWEMGQSIFDLFLQSVAIRALRGRLVPKVTRSEQHQFVNVDLDQVAGIGPAKAEALEIVECLMAPARFASLGAKCPKGLLLTGPPGCGKTLLAKAIASTAAVPFIARSGADFNRMFAGAGSTLVKELFKAAREIAPAVILIDELDYIGRRRGEERGGGLETDRSAALTQLLAEMDGFSSAEGVVVIGTTNRADILDKALLRPGRFDRHVRVPLPDMQGRVKILQTHASRLAIESPSNFRLTGPRSDANQDLANPIDWTNWARRTPGFSGADLAGLINEAAMAAAREGSHGVGERHLQHAYSKVLLGVPSGQRQSQKEMALTAAHEAGHAVVNEAVRAALASAGLDGFRTVEHISIVPAGNTGGNTQFAEPEDGQRPPQSRAVLLGELAVAMGGRAAEEIHKGAGQATMGAAGDFESATKLAMQMVAVGGLSDSVGPRSLSEGMAPSEETRKKVDEEVDKLLRQALSIAQTALAKNRGLLDAVSKSLIDSETLDGNAFRQLVEKHHIQPATL